MRQYSVIVVLALLAIGSFLLMRGLEKSLEKTSESKQAREIATAYQVEGRYFGTDNQLKYEIHSNTVSEFSHLLGTKISAPTVFVFDTEQQLSWRGRANVALLSADKNTLTLDGAVHIIESPNSENNIRANSEKMIYHADKREVVGDVPVRIESNTMSQTAGRFRLDIDKQIIYFNDNIKGNYAPKTKE